MSSCVSTSRALHLVDIENLAGGPGVTGDMIVDVFDRYLEAAAWQPGDLLYVAANPWLTQEFA